MSEKTATSILLEYCSKSKVAQPQYEIVSQAGTPNNPIFTISVKAFGCVANGSGHSKSLAKHAASQALIDILPPQSPTAPLSMKNNDAVGALITFCLQYKLQSPSFPEVSITGPAHKQEFTIGCHVDKSACIGIGFSKSEAKQMAAQKMLEIQKEILNVVVSSTDFSEASFSSMSRASSVQDFSFSEKSSFSFNAVGELTTLCQHRNIDEPKYQLVHMTGEAHQKTFTVNCNVMEHHEFGNGSTKKEAKQNAAKNMLDHFKDPNSNFLENYVTPSPIEIEELPSVEDVLKEYRRLKKQTHTSVNSSIRYRKNFFLKLPEKNQANAKRFLSDNYLYLAGPKEVVKQVFNALNLEFKIQNMPNNRNFKIFTLENANYDCTIIETAERLYERVIEYLKVMLNMQKTAKSATSKVLSEINNNY